MFFAHRKLRKNRCHSGVKEKFGEERGFEFCEWSYIPKGVSGKPLVNTVRITMDLPDKDWILNFWYQEKFTNCCRIHHKTGHFHEIDENVNEAGQTEIFINEEGPFKLLAYEGEGPGMLNLRIYEKQEGSGYVELGCAVIVEGENVLVNMNRAQDGWGSKMATFQVDLTGPLPPPHEQPKFEALAQHERAEWIDHKRYFPFISAILEPTIGYHTYFIPRSYFHLPFHRKPYFSHDWLYTCIMFTYKLMGVEPPETVPIDPETFKEKMLPIAQAFPLFVSRMLYTPDILQGTELEIYSRDVLLIGGGDCEDFAYLLCEIYLYLRDNTFKDPLLSIVHEMLQFYIPCHVLCQANTPQMVAGVSKKDRFDYTFSADTLIKSQKEMKHFHVFCHLFPTVDIARYFERVRPKEKNLELLDFTDPKKVELCESLFRLALEGTSSIYCGHCEKDCLPDEGLNIIANVIDRDLEPLMGYTFLNFLGASRMYGPLIQVGSEVFYKLTKSGLASVVCEIEKTDYLGIADAFFSVETWDSHIHFIPSTPVDSPPEFMTYIDPPYPIMEMDQKEIDWTQVTPQTYTHHWTHGSGIPYYPYNLPAKKALPWAISA